MFQLLRFLLPGYGQRHKLDIISHSVKPEADLRIFGQRLCIPSAHLIDYASADHIIGSGYGAKLKKVKSSGLIHTLVSQRFDIDEAGQQGSVPVPCPEFTDHGAQLIIGHKIFHQYSKRIRSRRIIRVINCNYRPACHRQRDVQRIGLAFSAQLIVRI